MNIKNLLLLVLLMFLKSMPLYASQTIFHSNCKFNFDKESIESFIKTTEKFSGDFFKMPTVIAWVKDFKNSSLGLYFKNRGYEWSENYDSQVTSKVTLLSSGGSPFTTSFKLTISNSRRKIFFFNKNIQTFFVKTNPYPFTWTSIRIKDFKYA